MEDSTRPNVVVEKSIAASLVAIDFCKKLQRVDSRIADQLFRSVTSVGANIHEAQSAESRADFIHKLKIASKELKEALYWMTLCRKSPHLLDNEELTVKLNELVLIVSKIISTSRKNK